TGVGIDPEHRELVFREFTQVAGRGQPRVRGSGLGLPLSRRLAELLGGSLYIAATSHAGSTFRFEVPLHYGGAVTAARTEVPELGEVAPSSEQPRILVIDDDVASRYVLRRWLSDRYRVEEAETGESGLSLAATR